VKRRSPRPHLLVGRFSGNGQAVELFVERSRGAAQRIEPEGLARAGQAVNDAVGGIQRFGAPVARLKGPPRFVEGRPAGW